ncbi:MAG: DUF4252 domain-containing protein [Flavobacteriaceae bacterium]
MRKIIVVLCVLVSAQLSSQSIFDKFEDSDRIGSVTINKGMLDLVVKMMDDDRDKETQEFVDVAKGINHIKIFMSEDEGAAADIAATMKKHVKSAKLEELMKVRDGDTNLRFYIKNGKDDNHVEELLMLVTGIDENKTSHSDFHFETVLLTMTGNIDLTKVGALTKKMDLHKGLHKLEKSH